MCTNDFPFKRRNDRQTGPQNGGETKFNRRGCRGTEPSSPREATAAATAETIATVDPDSRDKTSNLKQPVDAHRREAAPTDSGERLLRRWKPHHPWLQDPPAPDPGDPDRGEEERGRGAWCPRGNRAGPEKGRERGRNGVEQSCTLTLLLGSWGCRRRGWDDSRPLLPRRGLHLCLPVSNPATAILKPRAPPPSLRHFLSLRPKILAVLGPGTIERNQELRDQSLFRSKLMPIG